MARVYPFNALRPAPEYASRVAAPPYDVLSSEEARVMAAGNPFSFLHVDKAEIDLESGVPLYSQDVYEKACANMDWLCAEGVLRQDEKPCLYIYRLSVGGHQQTGLAACVSATDYQGGFIKKHELTRPDKEQDRMDHILACAAHTGPIYITYREPENNGPRVCMSRWAAAHEPAYDFTAADGIRHTVWVVNEDAAMGELTAAFEAVPFLYIADGHHRSAAAVRVAEMAADETGQRGRFLSVIFPHDELKILDYNRLVRDLNGASSSSFLQKLQGPFTAERNAQPVKPAAREQFGLYMEGAWYRLTLKAPAPGGAVDGLAVSILQREVFSPLLGIHDPQRDKRIDFVGGARGTEGLTQRVDSGEMAAAFMVCPTTLAELLSVADAGMIMPPKSTWFEPKLRSGLLIHRF